MIFDTHCHLNSEELFNRIDEVILDAKKAGVQYFMVVGYDKKSSISAIKIAQKFDFCYAAVGFHPTEIDDLSLNDLEIIYEWAKNEKVKAIGEIGLDYFWVKEEDKQNKQKEFFIEQIKIANNLGLPIIVHNRDAMKDCEEILVRNNPKFSGVLHCYSGSVESMNELNKLGLYFGFGGTTTFTNAKTPKETALHCDLTKLLLETDSPYLTPHPYRGKTNEPKYLSLVASKIAEIRNMSLEDVEKYTTENALRLFKIK